MEKIKELAKIITEIEEYIETKKELRLAMRGTDSDSQLYKTFVDDLDDINAIIAEKAELLISLQKIN